MASAFGLDVADPWLPPPMTMIPSSQSLRLHGRQRRRIAAACLLLAILGVPVLDPPSGITAREEPAAYQAPGTRRMAERLEKLLAEAEPARNYALNERRVAVVRTMIAEESDPKRLLDLRPRLATELLNAGRTLEAIAEFEGLRTYFQQPGVELGARNEGRLRRYLALSYLRLGEQENCQQNHTTESCLLPIRAAGVHKLQRGSRTAAAILTEQLGEFPDDLQSRWLLNIAYMTLGEYPDGVPARWLIEPRTFESEREIKRFTDVAGPLGLDVDHLSGGSVTEDFDEDGDLDLMVSSSRMTGQLRYFRNNANGTFTERTLQAGLTGEVGGLNLISSDFDNDGFVDVLVLRGGWLSDGGRHPNSLLRNNGDGTFADITEEAGLLSFHPTQTAVWLDYNNDGWLDLYIGNESYGPERHPCELFRNNGDGTFAECAGPAGVANVGFVKSVVSGDYNNDGRPDLYLSRKGEPNVLYRNDGPAGPGAASSCAWSFTDVAAEAGVTEPLHSFPSWFFDYDNDGWLDLFVAGYAIKDVGDVAADYLGLPHTGERARLYHNKGDGTFADVTRAAGLYKVLLAMGSNFGDVDNDGFLDFYVGTGDPDLSTLIPNRMFLNSEGERFLDVTTSAGVGHLQKGHGVSFADLDNDGDQDIYEEMGGAFWGDNYRSVLYENPGYDNHWITLELEGARSNRAAMGARIKVTVRTAEGSRAIHRTVGTGGSFGASPLRQEIGLGSALGIEAIEITWPAPGRAQILDHVPMDRFYSVREGHPVPELLQLKRFRLASAPHSGPAPHLHHR